MLRRQQQRYLAGLAPGTDIDHRGTPFTKDLLARLINAVREPTTGRPQFGTARFERATFPALAQFDGAAFTGLAAFDGATFTYSVSFDKAVFSGEVGFDWATFTGDASFSEARFEAATRLGPLVCGRSLSLLSAVFGAPVMVDIAAPEVTLWRTRWASTAALRLRFATVDLSEAVLEHPVTLAAAPAPFVSMWGDYLPEEVLAGRDPGVRVKGIGGVDAAYLTLRDTDLSGCHFAGAVHLDQLRLDGRTTFTRPPQGLRWSKRRTLVEEHHWRAAAARRPTPGQQPSMKEWRPGPDHPDLTRTPGPETIAATYRQLRKALEDAKNEPGAADFYYGECEMRRHDKSEGTTWVERALLSVYWALSGYGLRATRALSWLATAMVATVMIMMLWGMPAHVPKPTTIGRQVPAGQVLTLVTETPDPMNPTGPLTDRLTSNRFEASLRTVVNSVVFRSSGQDLTTVGTYTEMASRFTEPVLLGLAVLAIRNRVKR
ncbi:pentapeptide repeat-containing protein [Streptomyces bobili]|uniref:pentapeptide repeat-containing protein n=1 Tax=Streptomyces bobili TaxID=67280 RepID=UPI0037A3976D